MRDTQAAIPSKQNAGRNTRCAIRPAVFAPCAMGHDQALDIQEILAASGVSSGFRVPSSELTGGASVLASRDPGVEASRLAGTLAPPRRMAREHARPANSHQSNPRLAPNPSALISILNLQPSTDSTL